MKFVDVRLPAKDIDAQIAFYGGTLNLQMDRRTASEVCFRVCHSRLIFSQTSPQNFAPQHFAFNIPEHRFNDARAWLQAHCDLIPDEAGNDVIESQNWNSHSVYFYDADGNIGELIARHTQPMPHAGAFDASALLCVSEVGIVTDDPFSTARLACERLNASVYRDTLNDTFVPVGDEDGLLIIAKTGRLWYPNRVLPARSAPVTLAIVGTPQFDLTPSAHIEIGWPKRMQCGFDIR